MSVPALVWIDSIQVGNATAKALLRYLATHNFHKPGFFFKNSTYARALEISESTLHRALDHLEKNNFIKIEKRFDENGRQIANGLYLNIPDEFMSNYERTIEGNGEGVRLKQSQNDTLGEGVRLEPLGVSGWQGGGCQVGTPYNNKRTNNKINDNKKSFCKKSSENAKKHDFAESMDQMANETKHIEEHEVFKRSPMPESLRKIYKSLGKIAPCNKYTESIKTTGGNANGYGSLEETTGREGQGA